MTARKGPRRDAVKERFWRGVIAGQAESGLSVRAWCLRREVSEASFYAWRRELARRGEQGEELPRFAEVVVADRGDLSARAMNDGLLQIHLDDDVCGIFHTLLCDQDGVYDSTDGNDRLLLGMKGAMSEFELVTLRSSTEDANCPATSKRKRSHFSDLDLSSSNNSSPRPWSPCFSVSVG